MHVSQLVMLVHGELGVLVAQVVGEEPKPEQMPVELYKHKLVILNLVS